MHNAQPDTAQIIALPPLIYGGAFVSGLFLHLLWPIPILPNPFARWLGVVCLLASLPIAITAFRALHRAHTPFDPTKPTLALVTDGAFRYSRNPLYLSMTLVYVGLAVLINTLLLLLLVVPVLLVIRYGVIAREEAYLARKFGAAYGQYTTQVRRWL